MSTTPIGYLITRNFTLIGINGGTEYVTMVTLANYFVQQPLMEIWYYRYSNTNTHITSKFSAACPRMAKLCKLHLRD